jgi:prepilin-type N-terminal cleavage/methylation domain-containing protein
MRSRKQESRGTDRSLGPTGFTLVELLMVIAIIMLLATILTPTVQTIIRQVYAGRSVVAVKRLHDGILLYEQETKFLPGEKPDSKVGGTGSPRLAMDSGTFTGSQVLAACLFNIEYDELTLDYSDPDNADNIKADKVYAPFKPEYLFTYKGKANSLSDGYPKGNAKPILYFLSRTIGNHAGINTQFRFTDNDEYLTDQVSQPVLSQTIMQTWMSAIPTNTGYIFNSGRFILVAPGMDRKYFLGDDDDPTTDDPLSDDDITNSYGK